MRTWAVVACPSMALQFAVSVALGRLLHLSLLQFPQQSGFSERANTKMRGLPLMVVAAAVGKGEACYWLNQPPRCLIGCRRRALPYRVLA